VALDELVAAKDVKPELDGVDVAPGRVSVKKRCGQGRYRLYSLRGPA
jgi:hypothetical protein